LRSFPRLLQRNPPSSFPPPFGGRVRVRGEERARDKCSKTLAPA
jgi:hypothetical protein